MTHPYAIVPWYAIPVLSPSLLVRHYPQVSFHVEKERIVVSVEKDRVILRTEWHSISTEDAENVGRKQSKCWRRPERGEKSTFGANGSGGYIKRVSHDPLT